MTDITEQKQAEQDLAGKEAATSCRARQHAGRAGVHRRGSEDRRFATTASESCTSCPQELLQPGHPTSNLLRYLAENGYYGEGDPDAQVAQRVESLRNPTGKSFEDHAPDGRWYRILRRRVAAGGTVTVMTDITEQKTCGARSARCDAAHGGGKQAHHGEESRARSAVQRDPGQEPPGRGAGRADRRMERAAGNARDRAGRRRSARCRSSRGFSRQKSAT